MNPNQSLSFRIIPLLASALLSLQIGVAEALPTDKDQPTHISADSASFDQKQGLAIYTGTVKLTQGTLEITADKVTLRTGSDQKVETVVAEGAPAHYQQQPELSKPIIHAEASTITYTVSKEHLTLEKNAYVEQNGTTTKGGRVDYDTKSSTVKALGAGNESGRVEFVIPPQTDKKD